jgi:trimethylamine:corrinoid methyltransferase-like protein
MNGGNFLAQEHTRDYMRKGELYSGKLGNDAPFEEWRRRLPVLFAMQRKNV